ncbi:MAG: class I SAM-dependent methyltransferase, partial [candidate division Zixibacteria bacterium]|nr:class I SAM-dependent methyltransferase [candidate division Zixibacteria bacterium]
MAGAYSFPLIYDIAFSDRDVPGEVDFLLNAAEIHFGDPIASAIELACGPGAHFREMVRAGIISDGMDLSPEMVEYANELIGNENLSPTHRVSSTKTDLCPTPRVGSQVGSQLDSTNNDLCPTPRVGSQVGSQLDSTNNDLRPTPRVGLSTCSAYQGDMRSWRAERHYDLAYCLLVSFAHLLTNDDILAHFDTVADLLSPRGIYIV